MMKIFHLQLLGRVIAPESSRVRSTTRAPPFTTCRRLVLQWPFFFHSSSEYACIGLCIRNELLLRDKNTSPLGHHWHIFLYSCEGWRLLHLQQHLCISCNGLSYLTSYLSQMLHYYCPQAFLYMLYANNC